MYRYINGLQKDKDANGEMSPSLDDKIVKTRKIPERVEQENWDKTVK